MILNRLKLKRLVLSSIIICQLLLLSSCAEQHDEILTSDFDSFWNSTIEELESFPLTYEEISSKEFGSKKISLIKINSYNNIHFYVWLAEPIAEGKYKAQIKYWGFSRGNTDWNLFPNTTFMMQENTLCVRVNIRGQGLSTEQIGFEDFLSNGNTSKESYIYRGAFMDAKRTVDFIVEHPKSNAKVLTIGNSQGGLLAIVASALSSDVDVCVADYPFFSDLSCYNKDKWPMCDIKKGITYQQALELLDYFDAKNFAISIEIPYFSHCAEYDNITPLEGIEIVYDNINTPEKELYVVPCAGHGCSSESPIAIQKEKDFIEQYFE